MRTGLRERKKLDTRRALAEAALTLATERGYHVFTIADVTEAVGVSRRTFSNYFPGKAECLVAVVDGWLDELLEAVTDAPPDVSLPDLLPAALQAAGRQLADNAGAFFDLMRAEPELQAAALARDAAQLGVISAAIARRAGVGSDDLKVTLLAQYCLLAGRLSIDRWVGSGRAGGSAGLTRLLDTAFSIIDLQALTS